MTNETITHNQRRINNNPFGGEGKQKNSNQSSIFLVTTATKFGTKTA